MINRLLTLQKCVPQRKHSMDIVAPKVISVISKPLKHICNISFKTWVFPSRKKITKLIPVFKSGAKVDIGNYRLERLFHTGLDNFVNIKDMY